MRYCTRTAIPPAGITGAHTPTTGGAINHNTATLNADSSLITRGSIRAFARHFAEMLLAMFAGMIVLGGLSELIFAAAGSSPSDQPGGFQIMPMGVNMTVPRLVIWM